MEANFRISAFSKPLDLGWICKAVNGRLHHGKAQQVIDGLTTDSRLVQPDDLFIAIQGANSDGHQYIANAQKAKAAAVLVSQMPTSQSAQTCTIQVDDTTQALGDLAQAWRRQFAIPVMALTGSNGKTTTKEVIAAILKQQGTPLVTWKNWNNYLGLPLTLLNLRPQHTTAVIEMGMNSFGEIARLTQITEPDFRLITNVMPVHLEGVGDLAGVAKAKGEMLADVNKDHCFIVNADDERIVELAANVDCKKIDYSCKQESTEVGLSAVVDLGQDGYEGEIRLGSGTVDFRTHLAGQHNLSNVIAAAATAYAMDVRSADISAGIAAARPMELRSQWLHLNRALAVLNDCYNANPGSMKAAMNALVQAAPSRKIAALGDMGELGQHSQRLHVEVLKHAKDQGFDRVLCVGPCFSEAAAEHDDRIQGFSDIETLYVSLKDELQDGDALLVKGSRTMAMERVSERLLADFGRVGG